VEVFEIPEIVLLIRSREDPIRTERR